MDEAEETRESRISSPRTILEEASGLRVGSSAQAMDTRLPQSGAKGRKRGLPHTSESVIGALPFLAPPAPNPLM